MLKITVGPWGIRMKTFGFAELFMAALMLLWTAPARAAQDATLKQIEYARLATLAERVAAAQKYDRLSARIRVRVPDGQKQVSELVFTIPNPTGDIVFRPNADGTIDIPVDPALKQRNPMVTVNLPKDAKLQFPLDLRIKVPDPKTIAYTDIAAGLKQLDAGIAEQAGMMSFMAPSAKGVRIICGSGCTATLNTTPPKTLTADANGGIEMLHDDYKRTPNLIITLSTPATAVRPIVR
jgi:hypothetical protein